jgi:hypothetical protein
VKRLQFVMYCMDGLFLCESVPHLLQAPRSQQNSKRVPPTPRTPMVVLILNKSLFSLLASVSTVLLQGETPQLQHKAVTAQKIFFRI